MATLICAGGYEVTAYENRRCRICGFPMHEEVCCHRAGGNVHYEHCRECRYFVPFTQNCAWTNLNKQEQIKRNMEELMKKAE